jgi:hypothetical protein
MRVHRESESQSLPHSSNLANYELGPIIDSISMTDDDIRELQEAEDLARRFLRWDLAADGSESTKETLRKMMEEVASL